MDVLQFNKEYRVHVYETGPDGKLNLYSLFNYLQDIASDHAVRLGFGRDDLLKNNRFWVLSRMYAIIDELPLWEDIISIKTWPNGTDKLFALRNFEVRSADGLLLASATSSWLILDQTTRKVQRPDSLLSDFYSDLNPNATPIRYANKLEPASEDGFSSPRFNVRISDLDVNMHTNNVQYLKWAIDTYGIDFVMKYAPRSAEINYLAESIFDEGILIRTSSDKDNETFYNHSIYRVDDNKELCRIKIEWKQDEKQ
jgi:medium-chain acyl-[acyl-carrier-protein] hydrolase